jgi:hypothetical protein
MTTESSSSKVRQDSDTIIKRFHPIVAEFGFTRPAWDYDSELDIVRVQFENPKRGNALQIDHHFRNDSYSANYCRLKGDWQMCVEGKSQGLRMVEAKLSRWIRQNCEECKAKPNFRTWPRVSFTA